MPESRSRQRRAARRYQLEPARKKQTKASPRWFGPLVLGIMGIGVGVIVWNYMRDTQASNGVLWLGLGFIGLGFVGTTFWR